MRFTLRSGVLKTELGQSTRFNQNQKKEKPLLRTLVKQRELGWVGSKARRPHQQSGDVEKTSNLTDQHRYPYQATYTVTPLLQALTLLVVISGF